MSFPKIIIISAVFIFGLVGALGLWKKISSSKKVEVAQGNKTESKPQVTPAQEAKVEKRPHVIVSPEQAQKNEQEKQEKRQLGPNVPIMIKDDFPNIDRIFQLFTNGPMKLPIVETVTYSTNVSWLKGRPAWIADYANHYNTSRHFIARSLNGKPDYFTQKVSAGSRFNVFRKDKNINFYLLVDISRCKMGFYYVDLETNERVLLKTYCVGLGRIDEQATSGIATPLGKFSLGNKIGIYKPGIMGYFQDQKMEMIQIFGTRWLPFDQEMEGATAPSRGYGINGAPWTEQKSGELVERRDLVGKYESDGCIRLFQEDIEELFSIVITKPTYVVIVKDYKEAKLPGLEVASPR
ncbi:MAG TPA: L,D-transpeptidase [Rhabdochlamydiaceae bacterium]|nr:L,D-transpeptidase [Rhabdochlamydiaceae bacterium]